MTEIIVLLVLSHFLIIISVNNSQEFSLIDSSDNCLPDIGLLKVLTTKSAN